VPALAPEDFEVVGPFLPLCRRLGRIAVVLGEGSSVDRVEVEFLGHIAGRDTRSLSVAVLLGVLSGHTEEEVNEVSAPGLAQERGIELEETKRASARDFTDLVRVTVVSGDSRMRVVGTLLGRRNRPHLLEAWGQRFNLQLEDHLAIFRYSDVPGMIGRVGTAFGVHGINIASAAVGHVPDGDESGEDGENRESGGAGDGLAVMVVTTSAPVPLGVIDEIVASDGFVAGRAISL
jgi:D-3-phosphoglycerate dehydrogenase